MCHGRQPRLSNLVIPAERDAREPEPMDTAPLAISNAVFMDPGSRSPCSRGRDDGCMRQANHRLLRIGTGSSEMGISRTRSSRSYSSLPSALLLKSYMTCMAW